MPTTRRDDFVYDICLWIFSVVVDLFFREVHPRTSYNIPKRDPVIFVAAPHANQFVDPLILGGAVRHDAKRRISFLIAEKSMRRRFVGFAAGLVGSVSVGRALDMKKPAKGRIYLPDPEGDPTLVRGVDTEFEDEKQFMHSGLLVLPSVNNAAANSEIEEILGPREIRVKKPFKGDVAYQQLTGKRVSDSNGHLPNGDTKQNENEQYEGTKFSVAPHIDQSKVYSDVFNKIKEGGCIGIFPEGGSHDRTELLPLKAGVAIMALGALAEDPDCGVKIIPVGMNYFHPHKFRSRAVIEFGKPISVEPELVEMYKNGNRRDAIKSVLDTVFKGLQTVTTLAPDYETLMLIQAVRRLYNPKGKELPLSMVVELNRRLLKGYDTYKDDPRVLSLRKDVLDYNRTLFGLHIRDHQVGYSRHPWWWVILLLLWRTFQLASLSLAVLPGTILFAPVFIAGKLISIKKSKEALAASSVKIRARDVIATWKILVTLALTPVLDITYTSLLTWWTYYNRVGGRVPTWLPLKVIAITGLIFFPAVCFMALRFGEVGMDIFKSLRPLVLSIHPSSSNSLVRLSQRRESLSNRINDLINELGPELFPDFDSQRIVDDASHPLHSPERSRSGTPTRSRSRPATPTHARSGGNEIDALGFTPASPPPPAAMTNKRHSHLNGHSQEVESSSTLPRNDSFRDIGSAPIFASSPGTPIHSRSRTNSSSDFGAIGRGSGLRGMTAIDSQQEPRSKEEAKAKATAKADLEEVSRNLHEAMRERGRRRRDADGDEGGEEEFGSEDEEGRERGVEMGEGKKTV